MRFACAFVLVMLLGGRSVLAQTPPPRLFGDGERVLFQGDSITDGGRGRGADPNHVYGQDYAYLIAARCGVDFPQSAVTFLNRGVSGNRLDDLIARWQVDALDLKPDVISILIGINDVYFTFQAGGTVDVAAYEQRYDRLLADTQATRPNVRFILLEPFCLPGERTNQRSAAWRPTVAAMDAAVERLGKKYDVPVVPLQAIFDAAIRSAPPEHWIWDGIHPTAAGHQLIADAWCEAYVRHYGQAATTRAAR